MYITATSPSGRTASYVTLRMMSLPFVRSTSPMYPLIDVSLSSVMPSLPMAGSTFLKACGRMTRRIVLAYESPRLRPASSCPLSTDMMPERITSAMYAALLRPNAMTATNIWLTLAEANTT